jgi:hypothetical protein
MREETELKSEIEKMGERRGSGRAEVVGATKQQVRLVSRTVDLAGIEWDDLEEQQQAAE